jgi:uncharacterized protein YdhG (YjbR/CyaY superfamily)
MIAPNQTLEAAAERVGFDMTGLMNIIRHSLSPCQWQSLSSIVDRPQRTHTMQSKATTISEYLKELPPDRCAALSELRALIHRVAPKTVEAMQYGLPAFGDLCALASQKNYMALYVCESDLVKAHLAQLGKVSCGKGCIRFKRLTDLNLSTVESLLREIAKLRKAGIGPSCRT